MVKKKITTRQLLEKSKKNFIAIGELPLMGKIEDSILKVATEEDDGYRASRDHAERFFRD